MADPHYFTREQTCEILKISDTALRLRAMKRGCGVKLYGVWIYSAAEIEIMRPELKRGYPKGLKRNGVGGKGVYPDGQGRKQHCYKGFTRTRRP